MVASLFLHSLSVQKMTAKDDPRLSGRPPEFCRMSLKPGIGADAMWDVASDFRRFIGL